MIRTLLKAVIGSLGLLLFLILLATAIRTGDALYYAKAVVSVLATYQLLLLVHRRPGTAGATPSNSMSTKQLLVCIAIGLSVPAAVALWLAWQMK